jgi:LuxR family maltose regulon positive regulatory protein
VVQALLLLDGYSADRVESSLHDAERALQGAVPQEDDRNTWGEVAAVRALVAALRGDVPAILTQAHEALDCLDTANDAFRGVTEACLGAAYIGLDDLDRAEQIFAATARAARTRGNVGMCLAVTEDLTYVQRAQGRLGAAIDTGVETLAWNAERTGMSHPFRAALHLSLADLLCERHELEAAAYHLRAAFARPTSWNLLISQSVSLFVRAHLQGAGGDPAAALATLGELDTLTARQGWPWLSPVVDAYRAQLWLARGDMPAAAGWITRAGTAPAAPMVALSSQFSVFAYEHLSIAPIQVLLAQGRAAADPESLRAALQMAMHQQQRAVAAGTPWLRIKALVLQALAWDALGVGDRAVSLLREAIIAAAAERYIQLFAAEGLPLATLLTGLPFPGAAGAVSPAYLQRVLEACGAGNSRSSTGLGTAHRPSGPSGAPTPTV